MNKILGSDDTLSKISLPDTDQGISAVLLWREIRVPRENLPVQPPEESYANKVSYKSSQNVCMTGKI